jgi:predicted nucleotidyltransferase
VLVDDLSKLCLFALTSDAGQLSTQPRPGALPGSNDLCAETVVHLSGEGRYAFEVSEATALLDQPTRVRVPAKFIERIVAELHPEELWLFGSRARGGAREDSDWDFMAILPKGAPEQDLDIASVWRRLRDLRLQRVEVFTMTSEDFQAWRCSLGSLAEIVASTGVVVHGG